MLTNSAYSFPVVQCRFIDVVINLPAIFLVLSALLEHVFASLPQMERGVAKVIGGDPKGNNFLYTNGKCVIIRNIEVILHLFKNHN